jgi:threonine dehydrogenase-like Zn-dependent dehydrogenase
MGGTVSVVGAYGPMVSVVKFGDAVNKGLTLRMNQCPVKRQWPQLVLARPDLLDRSRRA